MYGSVHEVFAVDLSLGVGEERASFDVALFFSSL